VATKRYNNTKKKGNNIGEIFNYTHDTHGGQQAKCKQHLEGLIHGWGTKKKTDLRTFVGLLFEYNIYLKQI
jgi:hypothetical protein